MSNKQRIRRPRPPIQPGAAVLATTPDLLNTCLGLAEDGTPGEWMRRGFVTDATAAVMLGKRVDYDTARAAVTRTAFLLAFCRDHGDELRADDHLWGGNHGTAFSQGLLEAAATVTCTTQGFNLSEMQTLLASGVRLKLPHVTLG